MGKNVLGCLKSDAGVESYGSQRDWSRDTLSVRSVCQTLHLADHVSGIHMARSDPYGLASRSYETRPQPEQEEHSGEEGERPRHRGSNRFNRFSE